MFARALLHPFTVFDADDGAAAGAPVVADAPPPGAPPDVSADPGGSPSAGTLEDSEAAMRARVLGTEPPEALVPDDAPYRDVKPIRDEIAQAREQYGPAAAALASLPPEQREAVIRFAPAHALTAVNPDIGSDLGFLTAVYPQLDSSDREVINGILDSAQGDPTQAAELLTRAAGMLRGDAEEPATPPADGEPELDEFGYALDDPARPLSQAEFDRRMRETLDAHDRDRDTAAETRVQVDAIQREMRDLGYDPDSQDELQQARAEVLLSVARRLPDRSIAKAHEIITAQWEQQIIDQYASGKRADAQRPQPPGGGAPPSGERVLESLDDSEASMRDRLEAKGFPVRRG